MAKQDRAVRTRQSLVKAAAEVFAREGFVQASLTSISRTAGVSTGALHFHFESKLELAGAVEREASRILREQICGQGGDPDGCRCAHALQCLIEATHRLLRRLRDDPVVRAGFELGARGALRPDGGAGRLGGQSAAHRQPGLPQPQPQPLRLGENQDLGRGTAAGQVAHRPSDPDAAAVTVARETRLIAGLQDQWRRWVEEVLDEAGRRGELAEGIVGTDAAITVVAATVGFEAMSVRAPEWLDQATTDRFWRVMLPRLAAPAVLDNWSFPAGRGALVPTDRAVGP